MSMITFQLLPQPQTLLFVRLALRSQFIHLSDSHATLHIFQISFELFYLLGLFSDRSLVSTDIELHLLVGLLVA